VCGQTWFWVEFAALPLAFVAEEEVRGQSLMVCSTPPQNKHKLFAKRRACSMMVSLPSFPILSFRSDVFLSEFWNDEPELLYVERMVSSGVYFDFYSKRRIVGFVIC
jgi:hypothetical protein